MNLKFAKVLYQMYSVQSGYWTELGNHSSVYRPIRDSVTPNIIPVINGSTLIETAKF